MAWLSGWSYRKEISITGQSGAGTNFQVDLDIGDSAGGDFHLEGHCTNFPQDITVTDNDGTTLLDYWIEDITTDPLKMWVEVADDLGSNQTVYIYYGKSGATTTSNIVNTFIVGDDFEDAAQGDWTTLDGTVAYNNSDQAYSGSQCMKLSASSRTEIPVVASNDIIVRFRLWKKTLANVYFWQSDGSWSSHWGIPIDEDIDYYDTAWQDTGDNLTPDQWELLEVKDFDWTGHTYDIIRNDVSSQNDAGMWNYNRHTDYIEFQTGAGDNVYIDNFIIRKYNSLEPAFSSAGSEETSPTGAAPTAVFYGPLVGPLGGPI